MTEEEKKAIETINLFLNKPVRFKNKNIIANNEIEAIKTFLNLIEKLRKENERQQDIIIEKDRQLHLMHKEIQSVREQAWKITDISLKDILMLNTPKIIIESKEDIKGLLDNYIPKDKIRDRLLVVTDLKSKIDLSKKETPVEFYVLDYVNNLLEELLEEE